MTFLNYCSRALVVPSQTNLLLVPCLCKSIEAVELFLIKLPFGYEKEQSGLVLIRLPLHTLYDPKRLQSELCHEVAHFVGEEHRARKVRADYYITAIAVLASKYLFSVSNYHPFVICSLEQLLWGADDIVKLKEANIRDPQSLFSRKIAGIFENRNAHFSFIRYALRATDRKEGKLIFPPT